MRFKILFSLILLIAIVTRFYKLGSLPGGLTWDEAAIGYNAYGLVTNHRDEWLHRTPLVFQSFGDYKSPLLVYTTAIFVALFHLSPLTVRLPIALSGLGIVILSFLLTKELTKSLKASLFVMFMVTVSPWAILYSRVSFEATLATLLITLGVYFSLLWSRKSKFELLAVAIFSFALSLYAYHSPKVVVPLIALVFLLMLRKQIRAHMKSVVIGLLIAAVLLAPLAYASIYSSANSRALGTTIFGSPNVIVTFIKNYFAHLSPQFLLFGKDLNFRQSTKEMGVSTPVEVLLASIGAMLIVFRPKMRKYWWLVAVAAIGIVPAAVGVDVPHSIRAMNVLPWIQIVSGIGAMSIWHWLQHRNKKVAWVFGIAVLSLSVWSFVSFINTYNRVYNSSEALSDFGYGYEEAISYARSKESEVDKVYFTNHYGQAYIYLLFFKQLTPIEYQGGGLANYVISDRPFADAQGHTPVLIIGTPDEVPATQNVVKEIKYPDGKVVFRIVRQ